MPELHLQGLDGTKTVHATTKTKTVIDECRCVTVTIQAHGPVRVRHGSREQLRSGLLAGKHVLIDTSMN
jgi:hypothetical protein